MTRISEVLLSFVMNAGWQLVVIFTIASIGSYLLRNAAANLRYALWLVALGLSLAAPLWTVGGLSPNFGRAISNTEPEPSLSRSLADNPPQITNERADDTGLVNNLVGRRTQVVNAQSRNLLLISAAFALFMLLRTVRLVRLWRKKEDLRRSAGPIDFSRAVNQAIARCRNAFGVREFQVLCSDRAIVPVTLGAREPVIILPEHFCAVMNEETLVSIIGHEVAHISRHDFAINLICELISLPLSFHPLTYLIKREIERAREVACDELVTEQLLAPRAYARSLVRVANATAPHAKALVLSILDGNILEERIMKLTNGRAKLSRRIGRAITATALAALCLGVAAISTLSLDLRAYAGSPVGASLSTNIGVAAFRTEPQAMSKVKSNPSVSPQSNEGLSAQERAQAACAAAQKKAVEAIPNLIAMLGDDAKTELIRCWEGTSWSPALDSFKHPSPGEQAALALASLGPPAFEPLTNQLANSNATVRRNAAWAIGELTGMIPGARAQAVPQLISLLNDSDRWTRMAAARALGELHDTRATDGLVATLSDADWQVRELSAWALSEMKDTRAVDALCQALLTDLQAEVRRTAAEALGEIRSTKALSSLKQALNDPEAGVRARVGWAISELEDSDG
jgi:beta-lactamase regulating signal transducer with metallopeptidase domain